jgi:hypothetical protein
MKDNDLVLLDQMREARRKAQAPHVREESFFDFFVAELLTQDYQIPGPEHLQYGIVDGGNDCGVDAVYIFLNGSLLSTDSDLKHAGSEAKLELLIVQCKTSPGFAESALEKLAVYLPKLLDLDRDEDELAGFCNQNLIRGTGVFTSAYLALAGKNPVVSIRICYASRGHFVSSGVHLKAEMVKSALQPGYRDAKIDTEFFTARTLVDLARRSPRTIRHMVLSEPPLSDSAFGWVCLVSIDQYFNLITTDGQLDLSVFEANVRDHETDSPVNGEIQDTLKDVGAPYDFWWLNNGVTIVADEVSPPLGKRMVLTRPQIVNGLQTSQEIFRYFDGGGVAGDRQILIRVIQATESRVRDAIIKATNAQTPLPRSALRATEPFQRDIEDYLLPRGYYYDRRRNYYWTRGYDEKRIISMLFMGHSVASCLLQLPHTARANPTRLLDDDLLYDRLFDPDYPLSMFLSVVALLRKVQAAITDIDKVRGTSIEDWQYHVACVATMLLTRKDSPTPSDISAMNVNGLPLERVADLVEIVAIEYSNAIPAAGKWNFADITSDERVTKKILLRTRSLLRSSNWNGWPSVEVAPEYAIRANDRFYARVRGG